MKCDKCGFEHQSKTVCPKCGANVVYVNEEYLMRRRQWEEGKTPTIGFGTAGPDKKNTDRKEGRPNSAGLSFAVIGGIIQKAVDAAKKLFDRRRRTARRNAGTKNAPKKSFKLPTALEIKRFFMGRSGIVIAAVLAVLAVAVVATVIVKNIDRRRLAVFDGNSLYYLDSEDKPVIGDISSDKTIINSGETGLILKDDSHIYVFGNGKLSSFEAEKADVIAYDGLCSILYKSDSGYMIWNGGDTSLCGTGMQGERVVSGRVLGQNWALCLCTTAADYDYSTYYLYTGNMGGESVPVSESTHEPDVCHVSDSGVIYLDMTMAEYGIVNQKKLMFFDGGRNVVLVDSADVVHCFEEYAYCLDTDGRLYYVDFLTAKAILIENEVEELQCVDQKAVYRTDDVWKLYAAGKTYTVCAYDGGNYEFAVADGQGVLYFIRHNILYRVSDNDAVEVCPLSDTGRISYVASVKAYMAVSDDGSLYRLGNTPVKLLDNVDYVYSVDGYGGYVTAGGGRLNLFNEKGKKILSAEADEQMLKLAYLHKTLYYLDDEYILHSFTKKNGTQNIGYCKYMAICG